MIHPQSTRQYWEGQRDALKHCVQILRRIAPRKPTPEQLELLARAIEIKAQLTITNKIGEDMANMPDGKPAYQGKALSPSTTKQMSQGRETARRTGTNDPTLLRKNEKNDKE